MTVPVLRRSLIACARSGLHSSHVRCYARINFSASRSNDRPKWPGTLKKRMILRRHTRAMSPSSAYSRAEISQNIQMAFEDIPSRPSPPPRPPARRRRRARLPASLVRNVRAYFEEMNKTARVAPFFFSQCSRGSKYGKSVGHCEPSGERRPSLRTKDGTRQSISGTARRRCTWRGAPCRFVLLTGLLSPQKDRFLRTSNRVIHTSCALVARSLSRPG